MGTRVAAPAYLHSKTLTTITASACSAAVCLLVATGVHADDCEPLDVTINLEIDPSIRSRLVLPDLEEETGGVWGPYCVHIAWINAPANDPSAHGSVAEARIVRRIDDADVAEGGPALGRVIVNLNAPVAGPVRVAFDATEDVLGRRVTGRNAIVGSVHDRELARALGRVLATSSVTCCSVRRITKRRA
jgi:hypothetical protein